MIEGIPGHVSIIFICTVALSVIFLLAAFAVDKIKHLFYLKVGVVVLLVAFLQAVLSLEGFFLDFTTVPLRMVVAVLPSFVLVFLMLSRRFREYTLKLPLRMLTFVHVVRIPVELVLLWLYESGWIPRMMTFEGRNFDILVGFSAPLVAMIVFQRFRFFRKFLLVWNFIALGFLINIIVISILALPSPIQQFAMGQPNRAVLYFPYVWLPAIIVPIVFYAHISSIIILIRKGRLKRGRRIA